MQDIHDVLRQNQLSLLISHGDGHCLFYSFLSSWHSQFPDRPRLSRKVLFDRSKVEFFDHINFYRPYFDRSDVPAHKQLKRYLSDVHRDYNQPIADVYPVVLANAFGVDICVFDQSNVHSAACTIHTFPSRCRSEQKPLYLHRVNNDHYNGLRPTQGSSTLTAFNRDLKAHADNPTAPRTGGLADDPREIETAVNAVTPQPPRQYSSDYLKSLNSTRTVPRKTRKLLFRYKIWRPKSYICPAERGCPGPDEPQNIPVVISNQRKISAKADRPRFLKEIELDGDVSTGNANSGILFSTVNTQSIRNKTGDIVNHVVSENIDICAITETWLRSEDDTIRQECQPAGYTFTDSPRQCGRQGGGTGLLCKSPLTQSAVNSGDKTSFEFSEWLVRGSAVPLRVIVVYRPTYSDKHRVPASVFLDEFAEFLPSIILANEHLIITGDFNFHIDDPSDSESNKFKELLLEFGLKQHVNVVTHNAGHTLDLIITRESDNSITEDPVVEYFISDHGFVTCRLDLVRPATATKEITYRKYKQIDIEKFKSDIDQSGLCDVSETSCENASGLDALVCQYNDTLRTILDEHAPLKTKRVTVRPVVPWHNDQIHDIRKQRRKAEHKWRNHRGDPIKCAEYREDFQSLRNQCRSAIDGAKREYFSDKIAQCDGDQKKLFALIKSLKKPLQTEQYPTGASLKDLADAFGAFFVDKIKKIRTKLAALEVEPLILTREPIAEECQLHTFSMLSAEDVRKLIKQSPNKQCESDPIPTWLLKECLDSLLPVLTLLVNKSLQLGYFPEEWKNALVSPLLKKLGLELIYPNFRPVSNLSFISKLTEKASVNQLTDHMNHNQPLPSNQSAYRPFHSTETALLKVQSDILMSMDNQKITLLVMLDLSAAFDTVDHRILLDTMKMNFGVTGTALKWFMSYLANRTQQVRIKGVSSEKFDLETGVPQGSCLGPVLFTTRSGTSVREKMKVCR